MKKTAALTTALALLLSGCALNASIDVADDGSFTATTGISASKQLINAEQWQQMITGLSTGGAEQPPGLQCADKTDSTNFKYECTVSGSLTNPAFDTVLMGSTSGLSVTRIGREVSVTMSPPDSSDGLSTGGPSLTMSGTVKLPGQVQTPLPACATAGTTSDTVTMNVSGADPCVVKYQLSKDVGTDTTTALTVTPSSDGKTMSLKATARDLTQAGALGRMDFYDGSTLLGSTGTSDGVASLTKPAKVGAHALRAVFVPGNFWRHNQSEASASITIQAFTSSKLPAVSGKAKVGSTLSASGGRWSPAPGKLTYQWLRGGKAISRATKSTYVLTKSDKGKKIAVSVTASKTGYQALTKTSAAVTVK